MMDVYIKCQKIEFNIPQAILIVPNSSSPAERVAIYWRFFEIPYIPGINRPNLFYRTKLDRKRLFCFQHHNPPTFVMDQWFEQEDLAQSINLDVPLLPQEDLPSLDFSLASFDIPTVEHKGFNPVDTQNRDEILRSVGSAILRSLLT